MFEKDQTEEAVAFMADVILRPTFDSAQVEAEKAGIYKKATSMKDLEKIAHEQIHYTSFRVFFS